MSKRADLISSKPYNQYASFLFQYIKVINRMSPTRIKRKKRKTPKKEKKEKFHALKRAFT